MRILWICCVTLIIAFVEAQKSLNVPKPVIALEKRSRPPIWRRSPEERRKLSLFPKNNKKFVVTERSTLKTDVTKPMVTTKRPLLRKLFVQDKIDERRWSFPTREPMTKFKQFEPVAPHPKRNYNRHYKAKNHNERAEPSTIKSVVTNVKAENSTHNAQFNSGNLVQALNKINAYYTNKTSSKKNNKFFKKPGTDASGIKKQKMEATKINEQVVNATEKVFLSKPVDHVMQNSKPLKASSLDKVSEKYSDENDYESNEANVTQTINEQLNKTAEKVFSSKQVDNVMQNNKWFNASSPNLVYEEYIDENDYETSEANVTKIIINEQLKKTAEKLYLSKQVDNETRSNKSLNASSLDTVSEKYTDKSSEQNMIQIAINEQLNKTGQKVFLSKQVDDVMQNNKLFNTSLPNVVSEKYIDENDYETSEANVTKTTINEQLKKKAEKLFLSKQVNNVTHNNKSINASSFDTVSEKYTDERSEVNVIPIAINEQMNKTAENDFMIKQVDNTMQNNKSLNTSLLDIVSEEYVNGSSEVNVTQTTINEKVNETAQNNLLSIQISNIPQHTNSLKINVPDNFSDEYLGNESDLHVIPTTPIKIIKDQENEYIVIHNTFTEEPVSHSEPLEGRSLETNELDLNNQKNPIVFKLNDKLNFGEKAEDLSQLEKFHILKVIAKDASDYKDHELSRDSNNAELFTVPIHNINKKTVNSNSQKFEEISNNFYEVYPVIGLEYKDKISTESNIEDAEIVVTEKYENRNIEINSDYTNTERSSVNIINDLENLIEVIKSNTTSSESTADIADSQLLKLDLNIVEEYSDRPNNMSARYDQTTLEPYLHDSLSVSPIEITFYNVKTVSAEGKPEEPILIKPVIINQNTADQRTENVFSMNNDSVTEITENIKDWNTIFSGITNVNIEENINVINENSSVVDNLQNLVEVIKHKSAVGYDSEVAIGETQLLNLDMNIVEEYSDQPIVITTKLDGITQAFYLSDASLTETPIEILFDSQEALKTEKVSVQPIPNEIVQKNINKSVTNDLSKTNEVFSTINDTMTEITFNTGDLNTYVKDISLVEYSSEKTVGETQLVNLDMYIIEENGAKPTVITTESDRTTQAFYLSDRSLTESPVKVLSDSQKALNTEKVSVQTVFNENVHKIIDKSVINELSKFDEILSITNGPTTEVSLNIGDGNTYIVSLIEISNIDQNSSENNENSTIVITSPNLDEVLNYNLIVGDDSEVAISEIELLNSHINIVDNDTDKPHVITVAVDQTLGTKEDYIESEHEIEVTSREIFFNNREPSSTDLSFDLYTTKSTVEPATDELNTTDEVTKVDDSVKTISPKVEDINTTYQTENLTDNQNANKLIDLPNLGNCTNDNGDSNFGHTTEVAITATQLLTFHINIIEANNDKPNANVTVLNETTQKPHLNGEYVDILKPLRSNNELLNMPTIAKFNESVTSQPSPTYKDIEITEKSIDLTDKEISDERIANSLSDYLNEKGVYSKLNIVSEEISSESFIDHSINSNAAISNESSVVANDSSSTIEEMFEIMIAKANQFRNLTGGISDDLNVLNDRSVVTQEEISDNKAADQSKNLTDEIFNESSVLSDSSSSIITTEEISDKITPDKSENITDEISNDSNILSDSSSTIVTQEDDEMAESYILIDSSSNIVTQEEVSDETTADQSKNLIDEISNKSYVLNKSSSGDLTTEGIFYEMTSYESENLTEDISNESHILNYSSSTTVTTEEIIDDLSDEESEYNLTGEIANESQLTEQSKDVTGEDTSNESVIDVRHSNTELAANEKLVSRNKRSNNIIEEENLATTLSSFKYTGHGSRLGHDLRFKNINA
ncbi:uncharacterized protein [Choristoneura fumiferana]|uniref:uncharacterized protein n=1 Tax=Choristoneura fumiferana TaxID=7141 RepID=UPI003D15BE51